MAPLTAPRIIYSFYFQCTLLHLRGRSLGPRDPSLGRGLERRRRRRETGLVTARDAGELPSESRRVTSRSTSYVDMAGTQGRRTGISDQK